MYQTIKIIMFSICEFSDFTIFQGLKLCPSVIYWELGLQNLTRAPSIWIIYGTKVEFRKIGFSYSFSSILVKQNLKIREFTNRKHYDFDRLIHFGFCKFFKCLCWGNRDNVFLKKSFFDR